MSDPRTGRPDTPDGSVQTDASGVLVVDLGPGVRAGFTTREAPGAGPDGPPTPGVPRTSAVPPTWGAPAGNVGLGVGDDPVEVRRRRRAVAAWAAGPLAWSTQVHGTRVALVPAAGGTDGPHGVTARDTVGEADALVAINGSGAAVVVADCVPVLLADPDAGVVAAVHAGRRGLADGVVQAALAEMVRHGARTGSVRAAIGPAICGACYEVPAGLRAEVAAVVPAVAGTTSWGTPSLDLPRGVATVLERSGVGRVHVTGACTYADHRFFSHRRSTATGEPQGRFAGVVRIAGA